MIEIVPVAGRRDLGRFVDYAYERNHRDPHWIPPLRIAEREVLSAKKNPFFAHADVERFWRGETAAWSAASSRSTIACTRRRMTTIRRRSDSSRPRIGTSRGRC